MRAWLGPVVRLQVQRASLKVGDGALRRYDPAPLAEVEVLELSADGVVGTTSGGEPVVDVHNRLHPMTKNPAGKNGISLGFTSHYAQMRAQFGPYVTDGLAGENILVDVDRTVGLDDLVGGVEIETLRGQCVRLEAFLVAEPCVPFTRYALRFPDDAVQDATVTEALRELRHGRRGFYASYPGPLACVQAGDQVFAL